jgi:hypothetical protein
MTISEALLLVAWTWCEGASLAPQVISQIRFFLRAVNP